MRRIDELFMAWPFLGSRRMTAMLRAEGLTVNRKRVQRLMRRMGIAALGPKPRTTKPAPGHKIFPYLLRDLVIDRPNQVWAADITYIPIGRGFLYLVAVIDWASRAVLAWRLSNTMDVAFCVDALEEALARFGRPEIFNTDQGSQFTSAAFTGRARRRRHPDLDGRPRPLDGQRLHRAAVALAEVRGHLPQGLRRRPRGARRDRLVDRLLQRPTSASGARRSDADGGVARGRHRCAGGNAVDMTLRLDNAAALPTCPPPQQQQQTPCVSTASCSKRQGRAPRVMITDKLPFLGLRRDGVAQSGHRRQQPRRQIHAGVGIRPSA